VQNDGGHKTPVVVKELWDSRFFDHFELERANNLTARRLFEEDVTSPVAKYVGSLSNQSGVLQYLIFEEFMTSLAAFVGQRRFSEPQAQPIFRCIRPITTPSQILPPREG